MIRFRYPKLVDEGKKGPIIVREDQMEKVRSEYKTKKSDAKVLDNGVLILSPEAKKAIDEAIEMDMKNKKKYPFAGNKQKIVSPYESKIIEVEQGTMLVDLKVECKPRYKGTVYTQRNGKWRKKPMSVLILKKIKKDGMVRL